jgi:hypothetical protein
MKSCTFIKRFFHYVLSLVVKITSKALSGTITTKFHSDCFSLMIYFIHFILIFHFVIQRRRIISKLFLLRKIKNSLSFWYCWEKYRLLFYFRKSFSFGTIENIRRKMLFWKTVSFCETVEPF